MRGPRGMGREPFDRPERDTAKQVRCAMENVDRVVREAGLRGWEDVFPWFDRIIPIRWSRSPRFWRRSINVSRSTVLSGQRFGVKTLAGPEMIIEISGREAARATTIRGGSVQVETVLEVMSSLRSVSILKEIVQYEYAYNAPAKPVG